MTYENAAQANNPGLPKRTAPGGAYTFYSEADADLTTPEGRIKWFCAHFEIEPPVLVYDGDEPDQIMLTDELLDWTKREGACVDWLFCGHVTGALATYREKYRVTEQEARFLRLMGQLDETEQAIIHAGMKAMVFSDSDSDEIMQSVRQQLEAHSEGVATG